MSALAIFSEGSCVWVINVFFFLLKAETRAEFAERTVAKLEKTIDDLEGTPRSNPSFQSCFFALFKSLSYLISRFLISDLVSLFFSS